jgi:hypothetical protein
VLLNEEQHLLSLCMGVCKANLSVTGVREYGLVSQQLSRILLPPFSEWPDRLQEEMTCYISASHETHRKSSEELPYDCMNKDAIRPSDLFTCPANEVTDMEPSPP